MEPRRPRTAEREQPARQTSCSLGRAVSGSVGQKIQQAQYKNQANLWKCGSRSDAGARAPHTGEFLEAPSLGGGPHTTTERFGHIVAENGHQTVPPPPPPPPPRRSATGTMGPVSPPTLCPSPRPQGYSSQSHSDGFIPDNNCYFHHIVCANE